MRFSHFVRGRWPYIAAYGVFALLSVTVVQLDLRLSGGRLQYASVLYILLLGAVGLAAFLWVDYSRQKEFMNHLTRFTGSGDLDGLGVLPEPATPEQHLFLGAWQRLYGRMRAEAEAERDRGRRNVDLIARWAHHMKTPVAIIDLELQRLGRDGPAAGEGGGAGVRRGGGRSDGDGTTPFPGDGGAPAALLKSIREENRRLDEALQALLNAVRIGDFAADFKVEQVRLDDLVRRLINENRREFVVHHVFPELQLAAVGSEQGQPSFNVETDSKWLSFALQQLISNAIKYSSRLPGEIRGAAGGDFPREHHGGDPADGDDGGHPHGEAAGGDPPPAAGGKDSPSDAAAGRVVFRVGRRAVDKATVLEIIDDGIGIPPEDVPRVFEPFYTGTPGRRYSRSTGMGLYLAREVCRRLGHIIELESSPGKGTRVTVIFPDTDAIFAGLEGEAAAGHHVFHGHVHRDVTKS